MQSLQIVSSGDWFISDLQPTNREKMQQKLMRRWLPERFGDLSLAEVFSKLVCRVLRKLIDFRALRVIILEPDDIDSEFDLATCALAGRTIQGSDLQLLVDKQPGVNASFISGTQQKGDWCYVFYAGERVVSSGWYSSKPTIVSDAFLLEFPDEYLYMYRGFTEKDYRGVRAMSPVTDR